MSYLYAVSEYGIHNSIVENFYIPIRLRLPTPNPAFRLSDFASEMFVCLIFFTNVETASDVYKKSSVIKLNILYHFEVNTR